MHHKIQPRTGDKKEKSSFPKVPLLQWGSALSEGSGLSFKAKTGGCSTHELSHTLSNGFHLFRSCRIRVSVIHIEKLKKLLSFISERSTKSNIGASKTTSFLFLTDLEGT